MREEDLLKQRERRKRTGNATTKKYERTYKGKLMRTYRNLQSRCLGVLKKKAHLYEGLEFLSREEFYSWTNSSEEYRNLFNQWVEAGYPIKLSPSIDRINAEVGYILGNIRWVTHLENSSNTRRWKHVT